VLFCTVHFRTKLEAYLDVSHGSKISSGVCLVVVWKLLKICLQWKICSGQTPMKTQNLERNIINHVKWNQRITSFFSYNKDNIQLNHKFKATPCSQELYLIKYDHYYKLLSSKMQFWTWQTHTHLRDAWLWECRWWVQPDVQLLDSQDASCFFWSFYHQASKNSQNSSTLLRKPLGIVSKMETCKTHGPPAKPKP